MKTFILAALAASVVAAPVAAAPRHEGRNQVQHVQKSKQVRVVKNNGRQVFQTRQVTKVKYVQARKWNRGQRFDSRYATNYRVIHNPRAYRLNDAPRGYRYVQSGNDAVLIGITSGIVAAIIGNVL